MRTTFLTPLLAGLVLGARAATTFTEVDPARLYTLSWSIEVYNTTNEFCWDWVDSCKEYLATFSPSNVVFCAQDASRSSPQAANTYCGGNTVNTPSKFYDFSQNVNRFVGVS